MGDEVIKYMVRLRAMTPLLSSSRWCSFIRSGFVDHKTKEPIMYWCTSQVDWRTYDCFAEKLSVTCASTFFSDESIMAAVLDATSRGVLFGLTCQGKETI